MLCTMIRRRFQCAVSTGAGRLFDGVAALLGLCDHNHFEAQAALSLESAAACHRDATDIVRGFALRGSGPIRLDLAPLVRALLAQQDRGVPPARLAAGFHDGLAEALGALVERAAHDTGLTTIGLSGGVFCNQRLTTRLQERLAACGLTVLRHEQVPPNDGGIALGQAAIAATCAAGGRIGTSIN